MNNTWKIYMLSFISFMVGTLQFIIGGILDKVASSVGVPVSTAGQVITAFSLANAIGTPIVMIALAKTNRRKQLLLALAFILLSIILVVAFPGFGFLMASRVILGVGAGVFVVSAFSIAAKLAPAGRQGRAMTNVSLGSSASLVLGVPIGRVIAAAYDWKVIFWVIGLFTLMAIFIVAWTFPATEGEAPIPLGKQVALLKKPKISLALCMTFFMFISFSVVNSYIAPFLISVVPGIEGKMSIILLALGIASMFGTKLGGFLADRIGTSHTLLGGMAVQAIALILLSTVSGSVIVTITLLILWSIAAWASGPTLTINLLSIAPEAVGIMLSLNSSFVQLGFAAGAGIGGIAVGAFSIMAVSWIGAVSVALATVIATVSFRLNRRVHQ